MKASGFILLILLFLFSGCGILGSDDTKDPEPGHRNYSWTVDSVYSAPGGWMNTIWGSSPSDIWIGSSGGSDKLWHFDGASWEINTEPIPRPIYSIYGFSQEDVWMGTNGIIYHYNGNDWTQAFTYSPEGMGEPIISDIWGNSSSNVYAVGTVPPGDGEPYYGFILHFDGSQWEELLVTDFGVQFQDVREGKQGLLIKAAGPYTQQLDNQQTIYEFNGDNLNEVVSISGAKNGHLLWVNTLDKDLFYVDGNDLKIYSGRSFLLLNEVFSNEKVFSFFGRHKKDVFLSTSEGVYHYNGNDLKLLIDSIVQPSVVLFEKDVFLFVNDYEAGTNLIYHGTLSDEED